MNTLKGKFKSQLYAFSSTALSLTLVNKILKYLKFLMFKLQNYCHVMMAKRCDLVLPPPPSSTPSKSEMFTFCISDNL